MAKITAIREEELLFEEYKKIVDLLMHEDRLAWELVSIYIALQIGLISALIITNSFQILLAIGVIGAFSSFIWWLVLNRSRIWRENWFLAGLGIERQSREKLMVDSKHDIFEIMSHATRKGEVLEMFDNEIRYRRIHPWEKTALKYLHHSMFLLLIVWVIFIFVIHISYFSLIVF